MGHITGGGVLLKVLRRCGVQYFFANFGTEYASTIHDYLVAGGEGMPEMIVCPHEATAVSMAHGFGMVSNKPQAVLVHSLPGLANSVGGIVNASSSQVPLILISGLTAFSLKGYKGSRRIRVHWGQESRDQGELVRQFVKWDYSVKSLEQIPEAAVRAYEAASSQPQGPAYLSVPMEWLMGEWRGEIRHRTPVEASLGGASPSFVKEVASKLIEAENPLIITRSLGRWREAVGLLRRVAETVGARVRWAVGDYVNLPNTHPLSEPINVGEADVILVVEADVPWIPRDEEPREDAYVAYVGMDGVRLGYPIWGFGFHASETCHPAIFLRQLAEELEAARSSRLRERAADRVERAREESSRSWDTRVRAAESDLSHGIITKRAASYILGKTISRDDMIVNEYCLQVDYVRFEEPGTFYGEPPSGSLGWGLGAALGAKLAEPSRKVVAVLGDGSFLFNNPASGLLVSKWYGIPLMIVVMNDSSWGDVKKAVADYLGDPETMHRRIPGVDYPEEVEFASMAESLGIKAYRVENPSELEEVFRKAYMELRDGKTVLVDVKVSPAPLTT